MALNDYDYIKEKIRKITARPSATQLSDESLIDYINSFVIYDLPLHTRFFYNRQTYTLNLTPNVNIYSISSIKDLYSNFEPPAYIDGMQIQYYQDEQSFYALFPEMKYIALLDTGDGTVGTYGGSYSYTPIKPTTLVISAVDASGTLMLATDNGSGGFVDEDGATIAGAVVDYSTGVISGINFTSAVPSGNSIYVSANNYVTGRPFAMLYFNNEFKFFPVPDKSYQFKIVAYPNLAGTSVGGGSLFPELKQWGDVIAFGTALKIFTDNLDVDSYSKVKILFDEALALSERRTLKQLSTQRVATIYSQYDYNNGAWGCYPYY